jgi:hypothetical protein
LGEWEEERRPTGRPSASAMDFRPLPAVFPKGSGYAFFEIQAVEFSSAIPSGDINLEAIKKELGQAM